MAWNEHLEDAWFRPDATYAGKNHSKRNKTFICISNIGEEKTGFKTLKSAMEYADKHWPEKT